MTPRGTGRDATYLNGRTTSAPGARRVSDPESSDPPVFVRDTPGPLTVTGVVETNDPSRPADDQACTATVSATVQLRPALAPLVSLKRPRKGRDGRRRLIYQPNPPFTIIVKHRAGSDRSPITVRARLSRRLRLPKRSAKAAIQVVAQRASDFVGEEDSGGPRKCRQLICGRESSRGFLKSPDVNVFPGESRALFSKGLRVQLVSPNGYPPPYRPGPQQALRKTPFGADIELFQSGRRIARLRLVANCLGGGQSARCKFRKLSTKADRGAQ